MNRQQIDQWSGMCVDTCTEYMYMSIVCTVFIIYVLYTIELENFAVEELAAANETEPREKIPSIFDSLNFAVKFGSWLRSTAKF